MRPGEPASRVAGLRHIRRYALWGGDTGFLLHSSPNISSPRLNFLTQVLELATNLGSASEISASYLKRPATFNDSLDASRGCKSVAIDRLFLSLAPLNTPFPSYQRHVDAVYMIWLLRLASGIGGEPSNNSALSIPPCCRLNMGYLSFLHSLTSNVPVSRSQPVRHYFVQPEAG